RVKLLGRSVQRHVLRHYVGRIFATAVSIMLRLGVYDTQCGAKLFRVTPRLEERFRDPFISGWIFDVELIAREIQARRRHQQPQVDQIIYEHPLRQWHDVPGSKIRLHDWIAGAWELWRIYRKYVR